MTHPALRRLAVAAASAAVAAGALTAPAQAAPDPAAPEPTAPSPDRPRYFSIVDQLVEEAHAVGVVAEVQKNKRTWSVSAGRADKRKPRPPALDAKFRAASVTKQLVSVLVLQEVEAGRLSLETTLGEALPGVWPGREATTLRQLLGHTSGIPEYLPALAAEVKTPRDFVEAISRKYTDAELVAVAQSLPATVEPGTYSYSNTNFVLLGMALERLNGRPLGELMEERVFGPAKMKDSRYPTGRVLPGPRLKEYFVFRKQRIDLSSFQPSVFSGGGALVSTAGDLNRFQAALDRGRLIDPALVREMRAPATVDPDTGFGYGLGSYVLPGTTCNGKPVTGHDGASYGTYTINYASGNKRVTLSVAGRDYTPKRLGEQNVLMLKFADRAFAQLCGGSGRNDKNGGDAGERPASGEEFLGLDSRVLSSPRAVR